MKQSIIITSIFEPTEAVAKFAKLPDFELIVVGDKKTPTDWNHQNVTYLSVNDQEELPFQIAKKLPFNHYSRKMVGYLYAIRKGADFIIDTDDDNIPYDNWEFPVIEGNFDCVENGNGFVNIYNLFSEQKIWPRGLPLNLINTDNNLTKKITVKQCKVGVWQGLADEDPDVDAIYRLTSDKPCFFNNREPVVLSDGTICPFNTQNTKIVKELFPLLYLPTYVTFRFTDILRGLIAQPIMWLYKYQLGFISANVIQKRNPHDYMKDFISEIPMYQYCEQVPEIVSKAINPSKDITENLFLAYQSLLAEGIVTDKEMITLEAWINDLRNLNLEEVMSGKL